MAVGGSPLSVILETQRLLLRPFRASDFDAYARICADPEVMRYIGAGHPLSPADAWRAMAFFLGHWELRGYGMWAAEDKQTRALVGRIGLHNPEGWPALEVGWVLDRSRWGEGLATEGGRAAMDFAFEQLDCPQISSVIHPANHASIHVAEKLGMTRKSTVQLNGIEVAIHGCDRPPTSPAR
jgi:RimJ/RimL family protein N-acetyltransferase